MACPTISNRKCHSHDVEILHLLFYWTFCILHCSFVLYIHRENLFKFAFDSSVNSFKPQSLPSRFCGRKYSDCQAKKVSVLSFCPTWTIQLVHRDEADRASLSWESQFLYCHGSSGIFNRFPFSLHLKDPLVSVDEEKHLVLMIPVTQLTFLPCRSRQESH